MAETGGDLRQEYVVILNRDSGDESEPVDARRIEDAFAHRSLPAKVLAISAGDDLAEPVAEAVRSGASCIVAAGGDGTICGVADALADTDADLGVIPLGTFNYFARRFGIPPDLEAAVDIIAEDHAVPIDLGTINGRTFLNNASLGLYAWILKERENIYSRWGRSRLAAYWSVIVAMATVYRPITMRISVDGVVRRAKTPTVFVAMSAYQLDRFGIEGADAIREGNFAILLAPDVGRFRLIWKALRVAVRGVRAGRDFTLLTGKTVLVETRRSTRMLARDGERERMDGPYEFRIRRHAVRLRVSRTSRGEGQGEGHAG